MPETGLLFCEFRGFGQNPNLCAAQVPMIARLGALMSWEVANRLTVFHTFPRRHGWHPLKKFGEWSRSWWGNLCLVSQRVKECSCSHTSVIVRFTFWILSYSCFQELAAGQSKQDQPVCLYLRHKIPTFSKCQVIS